MWAVILGVFMVCLAVATAQAGGDERSQAQIAPAQPTPALTPHAE